MKTTKTWALGKATNFDVSAACFFLASNAANSASSVLKETCYSLVNPAINADDSRLFARFTFYANVYLHQS
jgi:hypothetical protein